MLITAFLPEYQRPPPNLNIGLPLLSLILLKCSLLISLAYELSFFLWSCFQYANPGKKCTYSTHLYIYMYICILLLVVIKLALSFVCNKYICL